MALTVRPASAAEIFPLRHAVLRPGRPVTDSVYGEDGTAVQVGAWDDGVLVGCATVFPQAWPGLDVDGAPAADPAAWRLRGMAVEPTRQGSGVGRAVLDVACAAARAGGARLLWAHGRSGALGFYARLGWQVVGEEFVTADSGLPHRVILLPLEPAETVAAAT